jgi:hypothetical protein
MEMPRSRPTTHAAGPAHSAGIPHRIPWRLRDLASSVDLRCLLVLLVLSVLYEGAFVHHGLNEVDEGWPLYAAMQLHEGATLYRDALFVFPPGHLLPAWIAYAIDPPGLVLARTLYAAFNVALVLSLYLLGRRIMSAPFAFLGAAMCAIATPDSHLKHLLFGYRYLLWSVCALLAFDRSLRGGGVRWMGVAGFFAGVALCFRLTPAFAVCAGIGAGLLSASRSWSGTLREGGGFALGLGIAVLPVLAWALSQVGAETLWREVMIRPIEMTTLQSKPMPGVPDLAWDRMRMIQLFVALLFRACALLYLGYVVLLLARLARRQLRGQPFDQSLLLAIAVWGGIYFLRSLGRSDEPHLASTLPPFCLLLAHAGSVVFQRLVGRTPWRAPRAAWAAVGLGFTAWALLSGSERVFDPAFLGAQPIAVLDNGVRTRPGHWWVDPRVISIVERTEPGDRILVLGPQSLFHVLTGRLGPGQADILMPGTFLSVDEEKAFLDRLEQTPPALIVLPQWPFDLMPSRALTTTAPRLVDWVRERYSLQGDHRRFGLLLPRDSEPQRRLREPPDGY